MKFRSHVLWSCLTPPMRKTADPWMPMEELL
jgi:hypothetical protein